MFRPTIQRREPIAHDATHARCGGSRPFPGTEPLHVSAERARIRLDGGERRPVVGAIDHLLRQPRLDLASKAIKGAKGKLRDVPQERRQARTDAVHDDKYRQQRQGSSSATMGQRPKRAKLARVASAKKPVVVGHPIAGRIRQAAAEQGVSLRELSRRAGGINETTAQKTCENLDAGRDVGVETLTAIARGTGRPLTWLLYGDAPPEGTRLGDLPGWDAAAKDALARFKLDPKAVEGVASWRVHAPPGKLDALFVQALARAWSDAS